AEQQVLDQVRRQQRRSAEVECFEDHLGVIVILQVDDDKGQAFADGPYKSVEHYRGIAYGLLLQPGRNLLIEVLEGVGQGSTNVDTGHHRSELVAIGVRRPHLEPEVAVRRFEEVRIVRQLLGEQPSCLLTGGVERDLFGGREEDLQGGESLLAVDDLPRLKLG